MRKPLKERKEHSRQKIKCIGVSKEWRERGERGVRVAR